MRTMSFDSEWSFESSIIISNFCDTTNNVYRAYLRILEAETSTVRYPSTGSPGLLPAKNFRPYTGKGTSPPPVPCRFDIRRPALRCRQGCLWVVDRHLELEVDFRDWLYIFIFGETVGSTELYKYTIEEYIRIEINKFQFSTGCWR